MRSIRSLSSFSALMASFLSLDVAAAGVQATMIHRPPLIPPDRGTQIRLEAALRWALLLLVLLVLAHNLETNQHGLAGVDQPFADCEVGLNHRGPQRGHAGDEVLSPYLLIAEDGFKSGCALVLLL